MLYRVDVMFETIDSAENIIDEGFARYRQTMDETRLIQELQGYQAINIHDSFAKKEEPDPETGERTTYYLSIQTTDNNKLPETETRRIFQAAGVNDA